MKYRADIDGLRAVAVLTVVAFHAQLPGFSGGYIGVDVFFVISGFLITTIILREIDHGEFSIVDFYERRARRILPALFGLISFVSLAGPFLLLPSEFVDLPVQILGAIFFVANIIFWRNTDYFSNAAESNLLLHTWTLGVEEQFYILAPVSLIVLTSLGARLRTMAILTTVAASFVLSVYLTPRSPSTAFYLLPTRAWELGVGSVLALGVVRPIQTLWQRELLTGFGLLAIALSTIVYTPETDFPGYAALMPVLGAALVIHNAQETRIGQWMSNPVMVGIGLISYSLYLWHWPILMSAELNNSFTGPAKSVALFAISIVAGWISWRYIERPFRSRQAVSARRLWLFSAGAALIFSSAAFTFMRLQGWPERFDPEVLALDSAAYDISPRRADCHVSSGFTPPESRCFLGEKVPGQEPIVVWSDSHGVELSYALSEWTRIHSITYSACPPAIGISVDGRSDCKRHNDAVLAYLLSRSEPVQVVMVAYYSAWLKGEKSFEDQFLRTINVLEKAGHKVLIVGPTPGTGEVLPTSLARGAPTSFDHASDSHSTSEVWNFMEQVERRTNASIVFPSQTLCKNHTCSLLVDGKPILFDAHHPSLQMARRTAVLVTGALKQHKS